MGHRDRADARDHGDPARSAPASPRRWTQPDVQPSAAAVPTRPESLTAPDVVALQRKVGNAAVVQMLEGAAQSGPAESGSSGLPDTLKAGIESLSGVDMSAVKVHYSSSKPAELQAMAYAQGTDIHVGPGQEKHVAHEAWHIVQQAQGRVKPTTQLHGTVPLNDDSTLEREADVMGAKAMTASPEPGLGGPPSIQPTADPASAPVQAFKLTRAPDAGDFVGEAAACHCHINMGSPHFKVGKNMSSRINFGSPTSLPRMQRAYDFMVANYKGTPGFDDCKEYMEKEGCKPASGRPLIDVLKDMLIKWGGLSDDKISVYTNSNGTRQEIPAHSPDLLNDTIFDNEATIRQSDTIYAGFLKTGGTTSAISRGLDPTKMAEERNRLFEEDHRKAQG